MKLFFSIIGAIFGLDQLTKSLVRAHLEFGVDVPVLPFFNLTHLTNTGVAFGLFPGKNIFFLVFGALAMAFFVYVGLKTFPEDRFFSLSVAGVIGGALGNLTDRALYGRVTDFLDFHAFGHHWPSFNVADSAICVSVGFLLWHHFRNGSLNTEHRPMKEDNHE